jgi:thiol:disulfide interchange protein DsbD
MKKLILFLFSVSVLFGFGGSFLMPNKAFIPHAKLNDKMQIEADIKIADGIYIYDSSLKFNLKDADGIEIAEVKKPSATLHDGDMVYLKTPNFLITLKSSAKTTQIKKNSF